MKQVNFNFNILMLLCQSRLTVLICKNDVIEVNLIGTYTVLFTFEEY